jgi:hypothetical protein
MKKYLAVLALLVVAQPSFAQDDFLDLPKALVQFDGVPKTGYTYVQAGNVITVTGSGAYIRAGEGVYLNIKSGLATDDYFVVQSVSGNSFTVNSPVARTTSGGVTLRIHVRVAMNIKSVKPGIISWQTDTDIITGRYEIRFTKPFVDERYAAIGGGRYQVVYSYDRCEYVPEFFTYGGNRKDMEYVPFAFYGVQSASGGC